MDLGLQNRVAVVTGGTRGIGRAISFGLAQEGCHIVFCARGEEGVRETEQALAALGVKAFGFAADVSRAGEVESVVEEAAHRLGRLDVLVNNVGGARPVDEDSAWQAAFEINVLAAVRASRAAAPHMKAAGGGSIIHIASIWGRESGGAITYNAVKAAVISHAKNLALQLGPDNIRVNSVAPGSTLFPGGSWSRRVETDPDGMRRFVEQNIASGRFGTPEEIANVVVFLASPRASWVTGACINVDGGQTRSNI